jgi:hypothetical protein
MNRYSVLGIGLVIAISTASLCIGRWRNWTFRGRLGAFILVLLGQCAALVWCGDRFDNWAARSDLGYFDAIRLMEPWLTVVRYGSLSVLGLLTIASSLGLARGVFWAAILLVPLFAIWYSLVICWDGCQGGMVG